MKRFETFLLTLAFLAGVFACTVASAQLPPPRPGYKWVAISEPVVASSACPQCGRVHAGPVARVASHAASTAGVVASWGSGRAYQVALESARYRAANGIKGHSRVDLNSGMSNGVGWSTGNSTPVTCFWERRNQGAYVSVRGRDGWYSTLVLY
jgi:hypothetical protein